MSQDTRAVVICHDHVYPLTGAGGIRTIKIGRELADRGMRVTVIAPSHREEVEGLPVIPIPEPTKRRSEVLSALKFNVRLFRLILGMRRELDLVVIHNALAGLFVLFSGIIPRDRLMYDITDLHAEYYRVAARDPLTRLLGRLFVAMEIAIIRRSAKIVVVSQAMKEHLCGKGIPAGDIKVVCDGVGLDRFSADKTPESAQTVGHVGLVDKQHGVTLLPATAAALRRAGREFNVRVVGDGRELGAVQQAVHKEGLGDVFTFTGHVPHDEVPSQLEQIGIGVITRPLTAANDMIITLKLMEYWASGTAVVAPPLKAIREIAAENDNIVYFEPGSPESLAEKVGLLLEDDAFRQRVALGGYQRSRDFAWDTLVPQIVDCFGFSEAALT